MRERRNNILEDGMRGAIRREMETIAAANVMRMRRGKRQYRRGVRRGWDRFRWCWQRYDGGRRGGGEGVVDGLQRGNEDEGAWKQRQGGRSASSELAVHNRSLR